MANNEQNEAAIFAQNSKGLANDIGNVANSVRTFQGRTNEEIRYLLSI